MKSEVCQKSVDPPR